jgi:hypothetical protein
MVVNSRTGALTSDGRWTGSESLAKAQLNDAASVDLAFYLHSLQRDVKREAETSAFLLVNSQVNPPRNMTMHTLGEMLPRSRRAEFRDGKTSHNFPHGVSLNLYSYRGDDYI